MNLADSASKMVEEGLTFRVALSSFFFTLK